ncbi:hypothetical protein [Alicyclobacillus fodiniaquatilis]|uniref:Uncharacterized protein n=1 Tax=Alicyclobacillus fodiniaquatilis TaxID=1661150 RepID=A0ABW4JFY4_9BACL
MTAVISELGQEVVKRLGLSVWQKYAEYHEELLVLRSKQKRSSQEELKYIELSRKVPNLEAQLSTILSDSQFVCAHFTFVQSNRGSYKQSVLDQAHEELVIEALTTTGRVANTKNWESV